MKYYCIILFIALFSSTVSAIFAPDDIIGIKLGSKFEIEQCSTNNPQMAEAARISRIKNPPAFYAYSNETVCWKHDGYNMAGKPLNIDSGTLTIEPPSNSPAGIASATVYLKDSVVQSVNIITNGYASQELLLVVLTEKYGKPHHLEKVVLSNAFGAKIDSFFSSWKFENIVIDFLGVTRSTNHGMITVKTAALAAAENTINEEARKKIKL